MILVLVVTWCLWNESFDLQTAVEGVIFGTFSLFLTHRLVLRERYESLFILRPLTIIRYVAVVFVEIYKSGFDAIRLTLKDELDVGIVDIRTDSTDELRGVLIANAITLTPGTVSINFDEGRLKVVWINCTTNDPVVAGEDIKGAFERIFEPNRVSPVPGPGEGSTS